MFDLLSSIFNAIFSVIYILLGSVYSLFNLVSLLPDYISIATNLIAYLPDPIISIATLTISIFVLYLIIGR